MYKKNYFFLVIAVSLVFTNFSVEKQKIDGEEECPICLDDKNREWINLSCNSYQNVTHNFHHKCFQKHIDALIKYNARCEDDKKIGFFCPICRKKLQPEFLISYGFSLEPKKSSPFRDFLKSIFCIPCD